MRQCKGDNMKNFMEQKKQSEQPNIRLYCMCGGYLTFDQGLFTHCEGMGKLVELPTPIFLIDHPLGKVLFETGLHKEVAIDPVKHWGSRRANEWKPRMMPEQAVEQQLQKLGLSVDDISYVILSSLMTDHAGGMETLPNAMFIVQHQALQNAFWPDNRNLHGYEFGELLPIRNFKFWELHGEDLDLFGDGSIEVLFVPSHSRGEQALVVRLPKTGTIVLPAGVIPQRKNLEQDIMTGTPRVDPMIVHASMDRLKNIIRLEKAKVIFHHDMEEWKHVKLAPEFYD